jgi:nitrile hydratase beta subunit
MNGAHDLGGMQGFGPINPEPNEPVFHAEWERRAFAITLAAGALGKWNIDESRYAREQQPPAEYLATTYYEHWLFGLEKLLVEKGLVTAEELAACKPAAKTDLQPVGVEKMAEIIRRGGAHRVNIDKPARFTVGQKVVVRNRHPIGHTRAPRYVRGRQGVIDRDHGVFVFADSSGSGQGPNPQHCYVVRFTAQELWGPEANPRDCVLVDLWDDHLDPA